MLKNTSKIETNHIRKETITISFWKSYPTNEIKYTVICQLSYKIADSEQFLCSTDPRPCLIFNGPCEV